MPPYDAPGQSVRVEIPGRGAIILSHLVLDYNGTLALDGRLNPKARGLLTALARSLKIHVVTADTFGLAAEELEGLPASLQVLAPGDQAIAKLKFVEALGPEKCAAIGNGLNDRLMVAKAALGVAVLGPEGAARKTLEAAEIVCPDIEAALGLLLNGKRLIATLRD